MPLAWPGRVLAIRPVWSASSCAHAGVVPEGCEPANWRAEHLDEVEVEEFSEQRPESALTLPRGPWLDSEVSVVVVIPKNNCERSCAVVVGN